MIIRRGFVSNSSSSSFIISDKYKDLLDKQCVNYVDINGKLYTEFLRDDSDLYCHIQDTIGWENENMTGYIDEHDNHGEYLEYHDIPFLPDDFTMYKEEILKHKYSWEKE